MAKAWAHLPIGRVVRLGGASSGAIAFALDPLPEDAPALATYAPPSVTSASELVTTVLAELEQAAVELFPAWLPGAEGITGIGGASLPAVRALALRAAAEARHFAPFLADLAERALGGTTGTAGRFPHEVRALGLARVLAAGFRRDRAAILVRVPDGLSPVGEDVLVAACEWLADRGGFGVWLTGAPLTSVDRVETVVLDLAAEADTDPFADPSDPRPAPTLRFPAVTGKPHPASHAEKALEAALQSCPWAIGRAWNQTYQPSPLTPPIRVDLIWRAERCVVEIDGPEHRRIRLFEADRRRDVRLQLDGYAVLRFTNDQIVNEMDTVLRQLERFLTSRRAGTLKGLRYA